MAQVGLTIERVDSADLSAIDLSAIRRLMETAFGDQFTEEDWKHAIGGKLFFIRGSDGTIVSHGWWCARAAHFENSRRGIRGRYRGGVAGRRRLVTSR